MKAFNAVVAAAAAAGSSAGRRPRRCRQAYHQMGIKRRAVFGERLRCVGVTCSRGRGRLPWRPRRAGHPPELAKGYFLPAKSCNEDRSRADAAHERRQLSQRRRVYAGELGTGLSM